MATKDMAKMSPGEQALEIQRGMGYQTFEKVPRRWLNLGNPLINGVLGSESKGIAYGKTIVITGMQSSGKTLVAAKIAALAQADGAVIAWGDGEESFDPAWVKIHGLDPGAPIRGEGGKIIGYEKIALFQPLFGKLRKSKLYAKDDLRLETAEEFTDRMDRWMRLQRRLYGDKTKLCAVLDSTTALIPEETQEAGLTDQNMRTRLLAPFLNNLTLNWKSLAPHVGGIIIYISQLRQGVGPFAHEYMPGGKGLYFHPHVHCKCNRIKKGRILQNGRVVGVKSLMVNTKNKTGGGSVEGLQCGFKTYFHRDKWEWVDASEFKSKDE